MPAAFLLGLAAAAALGAILNYSGPAIAAEAGSDTRAVATRPVFDVATVEQLRRALRQATAGAVIRIAPGEYRHGFYAEKLAGTAEAPILITAAEPNSPPVILDSFEGLHLIDCSHVRVQHLIVEDSSENGINIDDGGSHETPSRGIIVEHVTVRRTGPRGNHDALKLSGVRDFAVRDCRFEGWGGSGIDMVGCHDGVIERCRFEAREGFSQPNAVTVKGGSRDVRVLTSFFKGGFDESAIYIGGMTGLQYFRPAPGGYEAADVTVAGNRFVGSVAPILWMTSDGGHVHHNTIYLPEKWICRILQASKDPRFRPAHGGLFERNLVVFDSSVKVFVNVGARTAPRTFTFRDNAWFDASGAARRPDLPTPETGGVYNVDPQLLEPGTERMRAGSTDPRLRDIGADAYRPAEDTQSGQRGSSQPGR